MKDLRGLLLCPDPESFISGGNLYNRRLLNALRRAGYTMASAHWARFAREPAPRSLDWALVDSLYLEDIRARGLPSALRTVTTGLLCHYLPGMEQWEEEDPETTLQAWGWLRESFSFLVVPSAFVSRAMRTRVGFSGPIFEVPPILGQGPDRRPTRAPGPLWAIMAANLIPLKGVLPFLEALNALASEPLQARLELTIFGNSTLDPAYAAACSRLVETSEHLLGAVRLLPPIEPDDLRDVYTLADLYVSSSRFETFGMAVCESVLHGTPVLALEAGNVPFLLSEPARGKTFASPRGLAEALLSFIDRGEEIEAWKRSLWGVRPRAAYTRAAAVDRFVEMVEAVGG